MEKWFLSALISLVIFGFWGFFPKLAMTYIRPQSALVYEVVGAVLVGLVTLIVMGFRLDTHPQGILFGMLTGIAGVLGTLFLFAALREGKVSVVVSMTALYPVITILLAALFLNEPITLREAAGMALAVAAIVLLTV